MREIIYFPENKKKESNRNENHAESNSHSFHHVTWAWTTICSSLFCIWSTTSPYSNTQTIFVRIWSCRCIIYHPNGHLLTSIVRLAILGARKRRCLRTDVITLFSGLLVPKRSRQQQRKIRACSFRHLNFFRLFLNTFVKHVSLTRSLGVRPGLIRGTVCLYRPKKHFNDTRISSLFTIIRAMDKRKKKRQSHGKRRQSSVYATR